MPNTDLPITTRATLVEELVSVASAAIARATQYTTASLLASARDQELRAQIEKVQDELYELDRVTFRARYMSEETS